MFLQVMVLAASQAVVQTGTPVGLLLGLARQDASGVYPAVPQRLESCWLDLSDGRLSDPSCRPGLIVPRRKDFVRYTVQRTVEAGESPGRELYHEALVRWAWNEPEPPSQHWSRSRDDEEVPCGWSTLEVLFASPRVISLREQGGNSETCEPRGWRGSVHAWVQALDDPTPLSLSQIAGAGARAAYATAARRAHSSWWRGGDVEPDSPDACQPDADDDTAWRIARDQLKWVAVLEQQPGLSYCEMGATVPWRLPDSVIGFKEPRLRWSDVRAEFPTAEEAHSSPGATILVVKLKDGIVVRQRATRERAAPVARQQRLPSANIVLVQWAVGRHVAEWRSMFEEH